MNEDEDSPSSSTDEPINPKILSSGIVKHIYFDDEMDDNENSTTQKIIERPTASTIRVDSSDLISRCKDFIPLLSDTNQKDKFNENLSSEKDDDEINIPDILSEKSSKESGEASSTTDNDHDDKSNEIIKKKRKKKKKKKKKKSKTNDDDDLNQDINVNN
jgi:hypothetical protein